GDPSEHRDTARPRTAGLCVDRESEGRDAAPRPIESRFDHNQLSRPLADGAWMKSEIHRVISRVISGPGLAVRYLASELCEFQSHTHSKMVLSAILGRRMSAVIGDTEFELSPGQIAFTNAGQSHSGRGSDLEFVSIEVAPAMIADVMAEIGQVYATTETVFRTATGKDQTI